MITKDSSMRGDVFVSWMHCMGHIYPERLELLVTLIAHHNQLLALQRLGAAMHEVPALEQTNPDPTLTSRWELACMHIPCATAPSGDTIGSDKARSARCLDVEDEDGAKHMGRSHEEEIVGTSFRQVREVQVPHQLSQRIALRRSSVQIACWLCFVSTFKNRRLGSIN